MLSNLRLLQGQKRGMFIPKCIFLVLVNCGTPKPCAFISLLLYVLWERRIQETFWVQGIIYHYWWVFGSQAIPPAQRMWKKGTGNILVGLESEVSSPSQWVLQRGMAPLKWRCVLSCFAPINFSSGNLSWDTILCLSKSKAGKPLDFPHGCKGFQICQICTLRM